MADEYDGRTKGKERGNDSEGRRAAEEQEVRGQIAELDGALFTLGNLGLTRGTRAPAIELPDECDSSNNSKDADDEEATTLENELVHLDHTLQELAAQHQVCLRSGVSLQTQMEQKKKKKKKKKKRNHHHQANRPEHTKRVSLKQRARQSIEHGLKTRALLEDSRAWSVKALPDVPMQPSPGNRHSSTSSGSTDAVSARQSSHPVSNEQVLVHLQPRASSGSVDTHLSLAAAVDGVSVLDNEDAAAATISDGQQISAEDATVQNFSNDSHSSSRPKEDVEAAERISASRMNAHACAMGVDGELGAIIAAESNGVLREEEEVQSGMPRLTPGPPDGAPISPRQSNGNATHARKRSSFDPVFAAAWDRELLEQAEEAQVHTDGIQPVNQALSRAAEQRAHATRSGSRVNSSGSVVQHVMEHSNEGAKANGSNKNARSKADERNKQKDPSKQQQNRSSMLCRCFAAPEAQDDAALRV